MFFKRRSRQNLKQPFFYLRKIIVVLIKKSRSIFTPVQLRNYESYRIIYLRIMIIDYYVIGRYILLSYTLKACIRTIRDNQRNNSLRESTIQANASIRANSRVNSYQLVIYIRGNIIIITRVLTIRRFNRGCIVENINIIHDEYTFYV